MKDSFKPVLGTMTFGPQVNPEDGMAMVTRFLEAGHVEIDSAYVYNNGDAERILGGILKDPIGKSARIATKVNPRVTGKLDAEAIRAQLSESLSRLGRDGVDILYLHFPDPDTAAENTLEACASLHAQGKFSELGLSNFPAQLVADFWHLSRERGWPVPTVYQGLYNGLSRKSESELFPTLRKLGLRFYAYNPLAGGLLSGKYQDFDAEAATGRFTHRPNYRGRYWKKSLFNALQILTQACQAHDIALVEAAYRWLAYHSAMDPTQGDGIVIGASSRSQLDQNLHALEKGALPGRVVEAFNLAWEEARPESPDYFQSLAR